MAIETLLAQMGYRPKGSGGGGFGELVEGLAEVNKVMQDQQTKEAERKQKKFDQFKTLRDAGYSSQQAYDLILKGEGLPAPEGGGDIDRQQKEANLAKTKVETEKITGEISGTLPSKKGDTLKVASELRKEFIDRPEIKEFTTVKSKVDAMDGLLKSSNEGDMQSKLALDQGLITMFNKITDPNSVVRESEYERTPSNLSLANRFDGALQKLKKGGAGLTDEDRRALVFGAKVIAQGMAKTYNKRRSDYQTLSQKYDVDPELVLGGMEEYSVSPENKIQNKKDTAFIEGKIYRDAQGNKAKYINGQFMPLQ